MKNFITNVYRKTLKKIFPSASDIIDEFLVTEMKNSSTILDLGIGAHSPISRIKPKLKSDVFILGVDNFEPYIESNKKDHIHSDYLKSDILDIDLHGRKFDCAILLDVIEHFDKEKFLDFIPKLEKMTDKIIIRTPNGYIDQEEYDGNEYQVHKSGWTTQELNRLGFTCYGVSGLKFLRGKFALPIIRPRAIGSVLCNLTEPIVHNRPKFAFYLLCVKRTR